MNSFDEVATMLDELADEMPKELFKDLNGGIVLEKNEKQHQLSQNNDLYVLGEYRRDRIGRSVVIYYGSFLKMFNHLEDDALKERLRKTLYHEFVHHVESLAGENGLVIEDKVFLTNYLNKYHNDED